MTEIDFVFFNTIDVALEIATDLIYDFHLEADNLILIIHRLRYLHPRFCILCQVKYIMNKTISVRLLFSRLSPDFLYTNLKKQYVNDTEYLLSGNLQQNLSTLTPAFISTLKANNMIGVCLISVKLLLEKLTTWMNEQRSLSHVLTTNVFSDSLLQYLSNKDLSKLRLVSKETKGMIDLKRPEITFEQSKLPEDFEYTPNGFQTLCARYGRKPKDCALHIIYHIDPFAQPLFDRKILSQSDIKLSIKFICGHVLFRPDDIFRLLCYIIDDLKNTIYSLEIDLGESYFIRNSYFQFAEVLKRIPNLTILKLFDGYIQWKPFLSCIKSIRKLEELDLSDIRMITDLRFDDPEEEDETIDLEDFRHIWSDSLKHLKGLRIAGYKSVLSYNERASDDNQLDLVETILPCLKDFTQLRSFGCTADPTYGSRLERFIPNLQYLKNITKLDLSGSNLANFDQIDSLPIILGSLPNLRELDLSRCYMDMRFFEIILPAIQNLKKLRFLDVSNNEDFFPEDIEQIKTLFENLAVLNIDEEGYEDLDALN
jgi:Leucine-rich repeat (LRR) protein